MADEKFLIIIYQLLWFVVNDNAKFFFKVIEKPHVMITREEINGHALIAEFGGHREKRECS